MKLTHIYLWNNINQTQILLDKKNPNKISNRHKSWSVILTVTGELFSHNRWTIASKKIIIKNFSRSALKCIDLHQSGPEACHTDTTKNKNNQGIL